MFGFVTINENDLDERDKHRYRAVYCGICRALRDRAGQLSRLSLSHDLTFLALLHLSLYEPVEEERWGTCMVHPLEKRPYAVHPFVDYAADMTVALMYFKCVDDWNDDGSRTMRAYARALERPYEQARARWPRQCAAIEAGMRDISSIERTCKGDASSADALAHRFGEVMAEVFVRVEDVWSGSLRAFGHELGRFIYLMDAAVDIDEDAAKGAFNPLASATLTVDDMQALLGIPIARASAVFERLPIVQDERLLRSALYAGVWAQFNMKYRKDEMKQAKARRADARAADMHAGASL